MSVPLIIVLVVVALVAIAVLVLLVVRRSRPGDQAAPHAPWPSTGEAAPGVIGTSMMPMYVDPPSTPGAAGGPDINGPTVIRPRSAPHAEPFDPRPE